ncbi:ankyrin repeat-containing protein ITN1-like [Quercus robur]|uniref:ankyrin repeat-containing protein ITN1-like n=1 Tax=Quercus robur TaxID=38942 RepID=UPI002162436A|nr:ankyrin repeat-containing protein ITN1-like [Quercus robur]
METKPALSAAVVEVLKQDNYLDWSVRVKTCLMAQDLWDIVESRSDSPTSENEAAFKVWSKTNAMALHVIQISCGPDTFSDIREITLARIAWETLAGKYKPKGPDPSSSMASVPLEEDNLDSSTKSGTSQISSNIGEITSARIALDTLADKYKPKGLDPNSSMASVPLEEGKLDSSIKPGESDKKGNIDDGVEIYMDLHKSLKIGDWNAAKEFLNRHPHAISAKITVRDQTALHVAAEAGHVHIVEELVKQMSEENLEIKDNHGLTALTQATYDGNYRMAECMLGKNENLISIRNDDGDIPVVTALCYGHLKLARYLYLLTPPEILMPENGTVGATVVCEAIYNKALDIALDLVKRCPRLVVAKDINGKSPFYALACMPDYFLSGNRLVFWKRWIYSGIHIQWGGPINDIRLNFQKLAGNESRSNGKEIIGSGIEHLYEMKLAHFLSRELLSRMKDQILISNTQQRTTARVYGAILRATKEGNFEFVFDIVKADPQLMWSYDGKSRSIFSVAVQYRHAKIFSLIYGLDMKNALASGMDSFYGNNLLHMAGMLAPSTSLNDIPGAALQMQRELQWFKEVESIVPPKVHANLNKEDLTPQELFTKNHKDMRKDGEQWMKGTASSCTVVGALIVTIMFAAVFTVPGGSDRTKGFPIFLNEKLFMVFIVSDVLSLFSSSTSVLMFLGILTSRYAEEDFLKSLPNKMIIGLSTLFFSIATMMTAFSAALFLMLHEQSWIFKPAICLASIPITLFVVMQFPLLVAMTISTYGPSIFNRKMKHWF